MREYRPKLEGVGISKWEYEELRAFCRQYPEKKARANALLGIRGCDRITTAKDEKGNEIGVVLPVGVHISSPTAETAIRRIRLLADCDLIDRCARRVQDGKWERALILNCCYAVQYELLDQVIMPTANRNAYFRAKRDFYALLKAAREERSVFDTPGAINP